MESPTAHIQGRVGRAFFHFSYYSQEVYFFSPLSLHGFKQALHLKIHDQRHVYVPFYDAEWMDARGSDFGETGAFIESNGSWDL